MGAKVGPASAARLSPRPRTARAGRRRPRPTRCRRRPGRRWPAPAPPRAPAPRSGIATVASAAGCAAAGGADGSGDASGLGLRPWGRLGRGRLRGGCGCGRRGQRGSPAPSRERTFAMDFTVSACPWTSPARLWRNSFSRAEEGVDGRAIGRRDPARGRGDAPAGQRRGLLPRLGRDAAGLVPRALDDLVGLAVDVGDVGGADHGRRARGSRPCAAARSPRRARTSRRSPRRGTRPRRAGRSRRTAGRGTPSVGCRAGRSP